MAADANIIFKSTDGGQTWQDISKGLPENLRKDSIRGIGFFTNDKGLFLRIGNGLYHSTPNATAPFWTKALFPDEHSSFAPGKSVIVANNYWGVNLKKTNGTSVWSPIFENFQPPIRSVFETAGGTIFIGTDRGFFKTDNSGNTWKQVYAGGLGGHLAELDGVLLSTTNMRRIIRSTDNGENWALAISEDSVVFDVKQIKGGFAAITSNSEVNTVNTSRLSASYDGGKTWQPIDAGFPGQAIIDSTWRPVNVGNPAQGSADSSWHPKEAPLPTQEYKTSIIQVGENFFCGHTDGIYRSSDKGKTWKLLLPSVKGKMFKLSVSGNVIYGIQIESHC